MVILVTGFSGLIGSALRRQMAGSAHELRGLNRRPVAGAQCHRGDIADLAAIEPAFAGVDVVVHLAAEVGAPSFDAVVRSNVVGAYNVFEASRRAGVRRLVFASSGAVVSGCESEPPFAALAAGRYAEVASVPLLTHQSPLHPSGLYGASKVWGEALGRHYADAHGLSVICVRIGRVNREDRPQSPRDFAVWCSQRDIARFLERCIAAPPSVRFDTFFVTSDNRWGYRDLAHARDVLGWEPLDRAEDRR
ncbi:MAG TPA: NAD-dependent epimerase/dehydratase family protein [Candidatus Methylomirabilis sp.]|nr:NAD-dependent epimerase/dehydratase family protein [Candidatus Methylomirabilis sp.]